MAFGALLGLCLLLSTISAISNRDLPVEDNARILGVLDQARLLEALQLRAELGEQVWTGWGKAEIPVILWNGSYEFLFQYTGPPPADWTVITMAELAGTPSFRRTADNPQNFAVKVGETWTASIATKNNTDVFLIDSFRDIFPTPLKQIFPYRLLIQPSETQLGAVLHESFHVYQYQRAPERIEQAELIHGWGDEYDTASEAFNAELKEESKLLTLALKAETRAEKTELVRQFLSARDARRESQQLSSELIAYERWLEWEEGTAKYIEVAILKTAHEATAYQPVPGMQNDPDFKYYRKFDQRWSQELIQLEYPQATGEPRFYMSGMAQAFLLDALMPGWKEQYWDEGIFLEDLLRITVTE